MAKATKAKTVKMGYMEFIQRAIEKLRKPEYKGIHTVYSGFNSAFKEYYPGVNPVDVTKKLADEGKIVIRPCRGGVMLYLPGDSTAPENGALKKILG